MSPAVLLLASVPTAPAPVRDVSVPPGFAVRLFADNDLAPDISTLTIDPAGRVLVAGPGYVRVLEDADGDGVADRALDLIDGLKQGPMGLLAEGDSLYVVVDGGLQRYRGYDGKSKLKGRPETLVNLKTVGEHDAHAVRRGPDGWLYVLCGNMAGVTKQTVTGPRSPVKDPVAGTLLRISPPPPTNWEFLHPPPVVECVADGFRNAYSFDFNLDGEPFTYDSDNERCVGLPWYEPCRFYHVVPGGNYGWRSPQLGQFWRKPPYFVDCVPPVCYLGRGSPTGVACYRHTHFPEKYRGGFFLADWTFGRIHFVPLTPSGSTYEGKPEVFAQAVGTSGFAPTGLAVHPKTGELFVSIGGRGTRGGVYRISHEKSAPGKLLETAKRSLDWSADAAKAWLADCASENARVRRTALDLMLRWREKMPWGAPLFDAVKPNFSHADALVRAAAGRAAVGLAVRVGALKDTQERLTIALAQVARNPSDSLELALAVVRDNRATEAEKLEATRIVQLACGDLTDSKSAGTVFEGYTFRQPPTDGVSGKIEEAYAGLPRPESADLRREVSRTYAALGSSQLDTFRGAGRFLTAESDVRDDIHFLAVLASLRRSPPIYETADALIDLEQKAVRQKVARDRFWTLRVGEIAAALGEKSPDKLGESLLNQRGFGRPEHLLFVKPLRLPQNEAVKKFLATAATESDFTWTPGLVEFVGGSGAELVRPVLEKLWNKPGLQDAALRGLARRPEVADRPKFVAGLASLDSEIVRLSAAALAKFDPLDLDAELAAAVLALRRLAPEEKTALSSVMALLKKRTGETFDDPKKWDDWVPRYYRDAGLKLVATEKLLAAADGFDAAAWKKREERIAWDKGDAGRGRDVFKKASCAACHDGGRALGPPLAGVGKRFGRDDLITAVVQPNRDVPARYRATRVTTTDEKTHVGMLVYEAQDGVILQTTADTAVRIAGKDIASKRPVEASLMPAGLLDKLTDAEVADLFAYLRSLDAP